MYPEDIDSSLCTHIMYGFALLDANTLLTMPADTWADFDNGRQKLGFRYGVVIRKFHFDTN